MKTAGRNPIIQISQLENLDVIVASWAASTQGAITRVWLFGSICKKSKMPRDVDLALELNLDRLQTLLPNVTSAPPGWPLDLHLWNKIRRKWTNDLSDALAISGEQVDLQWREPTKKAKCIERALAECSRCIYPARSDPE